MLRNHFLVLGSTLVAGLAQIVCGQALSYESPGRIIFGSRGLQEALNDTLGFGTVGNLRISGERMPEKK